MAQKRMFSREITDSDSFLDLSMSAQCLYFHACLAADDEGFISAGKRIARAIGATERELDELVKNGFLIAFPESGVFVASHFWVNNTLRSDRFHETVYQAEKKQLRLSENKVYQRCQPDGNQTETNGQPDGNADKISEDYDNVSRLEKNKQNSKDDTTTREGSPEGGEKLLLFTADKAGIRAEVERAISENGFAAAYAAFTAWKKDGAIIGKYNDYLKGDMK